MEKLKKTLNFLKNKYVFTSLLFLVWISFFDSYSLLKRYSVNKKLQQVEADRQYYLDEIPNDSIALRQLESGGENLEKFARERYLMKKDSEDIYIVVKKVAAKKK
jgi:cell division protein FtsB